jgi:hypothetical protein
MTDAARHPLHAPARLRCCPVELVRGYQGVPQVGPSAPVV